MRARNVKDRAQIGEEGGTGPASSAVEMKKENPGKVIQEIECLIGRKGRKSRLS